MQVGVALSDCLHAMLVRASMKLCSTFTLLKKKKKGMGLRGCKWYQKRPITAIAQWKLLHLPHTKSTNLLS